MKNFKVLVVILLSLFFANEVQAQLWNQFRGPNGSGVATNSNPPVEIDSEMATWKISTPIGHSSPVLSEKLIVITGVEAEHLVVLAYDKLTGKLAWRKSAPQSPMERVHRANNRASSTAAIDDERVYVYFGAYGLLCYDHQGNEVWNKPIPTPKTLYGMSTSPILYQDHLILVLDNDTNLPGSKVSQSKITVLNKKTGEPVWETLRPFHRSSWSTPTVWEHDQGVELVVLGNGRLRGYDIATGEERWFVNGFSRETISRPIVGNGKVFASASMIGGVADDQPDPEPYWTAMLQFDTNKDQKLQRDEMIGDFTFPFRPDLPPGHPGFGYPLPDDEKRRNRIIDGMFARTDKNKDGFWTKEELLGSISFNRGKPNLIAVRPGGSGDITESHVAWSLHKNIPEIPTPVFYKDLIYMVHNGGVMACVDAKTGKVLYRKRMKATGHYSSSPIIANDLVYLLSENGELSVLKTGEKFEIVHQHDFAERVSATPAIDSDTIYIRTESKLYSFRSSN
jgi:outer membrane protein assembly factor BamB